MILKRDWNQDFQEFTEKLKESKKKESTLSLIGFGLCEKDKTTKIEISDSIKAEIANSKNLYILSNHRNSGLVWYVGDAIVKLGDGRCEKSCDDSKVEPDSLSETEDKELLELLDNSKDYIFVFNY